MSACTFFGHRDCPSSIKSKLRKVLIDLIESHAVDMLNTPPETVPLDRTNGAPRPLKWCVVTASMVH